MILQQSSPAVIPSLEEPRAVVQQLVTKFQADTDLDLILKINKAHDQIQSYRAHKLAGSRDTLHRMKVVSPLISLLLEWMKRVEAAKWEATRPADRGEARHAERMSELDRQRFALAKQIDQLELATQQLESLLVGGQKRGRLEAIKASLQDAQKPRITLPQYSYELFKRF